MIIMFRNIDKKGIKELRKWIALENWCVCLYQINIIAPKKKFDNKISVDVFTNILDSIRDSTYELEGKLTENVQTEAHREKKVD